MNIYYSPFDINKWNIFEELQTEKEEHILSTKSMLVEDVVLLYVGNSSEQYPIGV